MKYSRLGETGYTTMETIRREQCGISTGRDYRILGLPGRYRVVDEQPEYIVFLHYGLSEIFQEPYEYPISFHRSDIRTMDLIPG